MHYVVIKRNPASVKAIKGSTYGICACTFSDGLLEVAKCVYDISDDMVWMKALADKLNKNDAEPVHLCDIIEDELYDKNSST